MNNRLQQLTRYDLHPIPRLVKNSKFRVKIFNGHSYDFESYTQNFIIYISRPMVSIYEEGREATLTIILKVNEIDIAQKPNWRIILQKHTPRVKTSETDSMGNLHIYPLFLFPGMQALHEIENQLTFEFSLKELAILAIRKSLLTDGRIVGVRNLLFPLPLQKTIEYPHAFEQGTINSIFLLVLLLFKGTTINSNLIHINIGYY